ncbi:cysteine--tRNA ligase [Blattabacterium cuenoti]|uniref:cysteine--tRNA ligase n=1 Tax=Blattabacterium cuenoti TaxID=1653831 RepID=UPI00163BB9FF|nr:cysteine--tRNA ligase [Blattabacterium cuenoti]
MENIEYKNCIRNQIKIYNSLKGKKELFHPINREYIGIYVCGPTVYNDIHLGNCRTFISFDLVFRYFKHLGYKVRYVRNITDVGHLENEKDDGEDKISKKSRIEGLEPMEIVQKYTLSFHEILNLFNTLPPSIEPTATGHLIEQIDLIQELIKKDLAYEINGSVYFDIKEYNKKFSSYGKLSRNKIHKLFNEKKFIFSGEKRSKQDFSIWKRASYNHIMNWNSPWGKGFPGWHIECTTMSTKYLGEVFDIHGGGIDLKFPHHECELAQAVGVYGNNKDYLAHYWMHTNMLTLNGKKMSKSTGNLLVLKDIINKNFHPTIIRFFILQSHYRSILNFSNQGLINAEKGYYRLMNAVEKLKYFSLNEKSKKNNSLLHFSIIDKWIKDCYNAINDDFNIPLLISHIFKATQLINHSINNMGSSDINLLNKYMNYFLFDILGLQTFEKKYLEDTSKKLKILTQRLIKFRREERKKKNWILSDRIRKELFHAGISLHDDKLS